MNSQPRTAAAGCVPAFATVPCPVAWATADRTSTSRNIGYSRNARLIQNPRTDPLRSREAGTM